VALMNHQRLMLLLPALLCCAVSLPAQKFDYRLLATTKTSTMEKEMNQAAEAGFAFGGVMGGESKRGGKEVIVVMTRDTSEAGTKKKYKLLAASLTATLQKELRHAGAEGYEFCGQTVFESAFGGREVAVILEQSDASRTKRIEYKLLATTQTSTMQKELRQAGEAGFKFLGVLVGKTEMGGKEVISLLSRVEK
jgi:hypothetical protein